MNNIQKLNILNAIYYEKCEMSFESLLSSISSRDIGFDSIAIFSFNQKDERLNLEEIATGIHHFPPSLEPDNPKNPDHMLKIAAGSYLFMQLPICPIEKLKLVLLPFINGKKSGKIIIRIIKENLFEETMQFIMP